MDWRQKRGEGRRETETWAQDRNTRGARNVIPDHLVCVVRLGKKARPKERAMGQGSAIARFWEVGGPHSGGYEIGFYWQKEDKVRKKAFL